MARRRHTPEQTIRKLREGEKLLNEGKGIDKVCKHLEVSAPTWHRWVDRAGNPLPRPGRQLRRAVIENLLRNELIICDEVGFAPLDNTGT